MPLGSPYVIDELEFQVFEGLLDVDNRQDFDTLKRMSQNADQPKDGALEI